MDKIFTTFLFPPLLRNSGGAGHATRHLMPVLDGESRKELYNLTHALCEDFSSYGRLIKLTLDVIPHGRTLCLAF